MPLPKLPPSPYDLSSSSSVGVVGLGDMGLPLALSLHDAGYDVCGFDLRPERMEALKAKGVRPAASLQDLATAVAVVVCSLPSSSAFLKVARDELLPSMREGQRILETGTTVPAAFIELHAEGATGGIRINDAPLSGGRWGAEKRQLHVFFGGSDEDFAAYRPLLTAFAGSELLHHCGPVGAGQAMKGVNQLKMAYENAAALEILAFAHHSELDLKQVASTFRNTHLAKAADAVLAGIGNDLGVKFRELPYYLEEATRKGFHLPMTAALHTFCDKGERIAFDDHRPAPSFWHELTKSPSVSPPP